MYQSSLLLESAGYEVKTTTDKGKLTSWLECIINESKRDPLQPNYSKSIQQILRPSVRQAFWASQEPQVLLALGLRQGNKRYL